jgi:hypothetical protein
VKYIVETGSSKVSHVGEKEDPSYETRNQFSRSMFFLWLVL